MKKILIVDDEMLMRTGVRFLCDWEQHGFSIVGEASNGKEALEIIKNTHPDIVLTDMRMPIMDGVELIKRVKSEYPEILLFVLSGFDDFVSVKEAFKNGISDFFLKNQLNKDEMVQAFNRYTKPDSNEIKSNSSPEYLLLKNIVTKTDDSDGLIARFNTAGIDFLQGREFYLISFTPHSNEINSTIIAPFVNTVFLDLPHTLAVLSSTGQLYLLFQSTEQSINEDVERRIAEIKFEIEEFYIAISPPLCSLCDLPSSAQRLKDIDEYAFYSYDCIVLNDKIVYSDSAVKFDIKTYLDHIERYDLRGAKNTMIDFIERINSERSIPKYRYKKIIQEQFFALFQHLNKIISNYEVLIEPKMTTLRLVEDSLDCKELLENAKHCWDIIERIIAQNRSVTGNDLFERIHKLVIDRCSDDLKLSDVAGEMHLNYSYLSSLFHQITDETFTEYLQKVRIEKAKSIILESKEKIPTVYLDVGFSNQSYFIQVFKKHVGCTPGQFYKRSH